MEGPTPAAESSHPSAEEQKIAQFREEITDYQQQEERGERRTAHLVETANYPALDISKLTVREMRIWEKVKRRSIAREDIDQYTAELIDENGQRREGVDPTLTTTFLPFIRNEASDIIVRRELKERREN